MTASATPGNRSAGRTRPIKSRRDYEGTLSVSQRLLAYSQRDTAAELRLQALLKEMDHFESVESIKGGEEDAADDLSGDAVYGGSRRRWSDDGADD
jgi:hypothetical protein